MMSATPARLVTPRWYFIPVRVLIVTFLLTLLSFAASLLLGIVAAVIAGWIRGVPPNLTVAYRHVALPTAITVAATGLIAMTIMEIRNYRQTKALSGIARSSG
ncbi:MAG: hypothetical protein LAO09_11395 [Acidobacteriia bacterium]|nr:hypothetical protein [Terriglobia bacterium]